MKAFLATVLLITAPAAFAQTFSAAPPLAQQGRADVFDWREVPRGQAIGIVRAVFDSSGYLLTDDNGQLISVPFSGNLYALQFGKTSGSMYFIHDGNGVPTLYLPDNGFLENAVVSGAQWYPFPQRYFYTRPVYLGPAPSWDAYCNMGWYPGMTIYGGFWGNSPWRTGVVYSPMSCLTISWGNRLWNSWNDYCGFWPNAGVQPIIIRDTRPIFIDQRERFDRSRGNDRNWDRDRPTYREPSRPGFSAPARHSEERAQGQGGVDRFNYSNRNTTPSRSDVPGYSRERELKRPGNESSRGAVVRGNGASLPNNGSAFPSRERDFGRPQASPGYAVPNMTPNRSSGSYTPPNNGGFPSGGSREREYNRPSGNPSGGYAVPNMTPARPSGGSFGSSPNGGSREREFGRSSDQGRSFDQGRTRTYEAPRDSRSSSSSSRESQSTSRERERGKR